MARINLLPWREEYRKQKEKEFYQMVGAAVVVGALIVGGIHMQMATLIDNQQNRNSMLQEEIKRVEAKINQIKKLEAQKKQLLSRMRVIERLQSNRPEIVHIFEQFVLLVPEGLYLKSIAQSGEDFKISGVAQSNARVSRLLRGFDESSWFKEPKLEVIQGGAGSNKDMRTFTLSVKQSRPSDQEKNK